MLTDRSALIVNEGECARFAVHTKQVHHRDIPEIWSEAGSVAEAAEHLIHQLSRARDAAACPSHRETIERAIVDIFEDVAKLNRERLEEQSESDGADLHPGDGSLAQEVSVIVS